MAERMPAVWRVVVHDLSARWRGWVAFALLAGLPLGVAAGRWAWALFAAGLGVPADAAIPVTVILVIVPAVLVAANAVAFGPGRTAARRHPAEILRAEQGAATRCAGPAPAGPERRSSRARPR